MKGTGSVVSSGVLSVAGDGSPDVSDTGDSYSVSDRYTTPNKLNRRDPGLLKRFNSIGSTESEFRSQSKGSNGPGPGVRAMKGWSNDSEYSVSSRMTEGSQSNLGQEHKYVQWQQHGHDQMNSQSDRQRCVLNKLNRADSSIEMTENAYSTELRRLQNVSKNRQNTNTQTKNAEFQTKNYLPMISEQFCSEQSFGQLNMLVSRNTSSVVACYNRNGERNSGAKNVLKEIIEKKLHSSEENNENEKKNSSRFRQYLKVAGKFLFDSLTLLLFKSPLFTIISLTSFFFFILLEPLFFIFTFLVFLFFSFFFSGKS